jgi:drug/metabolite transporter (DMT)-like permease
MKKILAAMVCLYVCWGSTYLAIHYALQSFPPLTMSGVRFLVAGALLCVFRYNAEALRNPGFWKSAFAVGLLLLVGGTGAVAWAEQTISSAQAALSVATVPVWMAVADWLGPARKLPSAATLAGIVLGTSGVAMLMGGPGEWEMGSLAVLLAALSWTAGSLLSRHVSKPKDTVLFTGMTMLWAGAIMTGLGLVRAEALAGPVTTSALLAWAYLVVAGSLMGLTAYTWLLDNAPPTVVATYTYVNPVIAVVLAAVAGEPLPEQMALATVMVVAGVALIALQNVRIAPRVFEPHLPMVGRVSPAAARRAA